MNQKIKLLMLAAALCSLTLSPGRALGVTVTTRAAGGLATATTSGSDWTLKWSGVIPGWVVKAQASFNGGPFAPVPPAESPITSKDGSTFAATPNIAGPGGAWGRGQATNEGTFGVFSGEWNWALSAVAFQPPAVPGTVTTLAWYVDPVGVAIGDAGRTITYSQSVLAGTQIQEPNPMDPSGDAPALQLDGRFGIGDFRDPAQPEGLSPDVFWEAEGAGIYDLFSISVFENEAGNLEADVVFSGGSAGIDVGFDTTASAVRSAIESADWVKDSGVWTLSEDLLLFGIDVTNQDASLFGADAAFGARQGTSGFDWAIPEPTTLALTLAGAALMLRRPAGGALRRAARR